mmetsp:Transcript_619/g.749  ORF Transcript_619/g.749 Transcript_619/m.749 type:complete len:95 (-) Transcript_619:40-324(-)
MGPSSESFDYAAETGDGASEESNESVVEAMDKDGAFIILRCLKSQGCKAMISAMLPYFAMSVLAKTGLLETIQKRKVKTQPEVLRYTGCLETPP